MEHIRLNWALVYFAQITCWLRWWIPWHCPPIAHRLLCGIVYNFWLIFENLTNKILYLSITIDVYHLLSRFHSELVTIRLCKISFCDGLKRGQFSRGFSFIHSEVVLTVGPVFSASSIAVLSKRSVWIFDGFSIQYTVYCLIESLLIN